MKIYKVIYYQHDAEIQVDVFRSALDAIICATDYLKIFIDRKTVEDIERQVTAEADFPFFDPIEYIGLWKEIKERCSQFYEFSDERIDVYEDRLQ